MKISEETCFGCVTYQNILRSTQKSESKCMMDFSYGCYCVECLVKPICKIKSSCPLFVKQVILTYPSKPGLNDFMRLVPNDLKIKLKKEGVSVC